MRQPHRPLPTARHPADRPGATRHDRQRPRVARGSPEPAELVAAREAIAGWLASERRLRLKADRVEPVPAVAPPAPPPAPPPLPTPAIARALLALRTDEETQARIDELADKCRRRTASLTRELTFR